MGSVTQNVSQKEAEEANWNPLPLDYLLEKYSLADSRIQILLGIWIVLLALSIASVLLLSPMEAFMGQTRQDSLYSFFLMYPPLLLGTLLMFWIGFEWGFIPVFISAFVIAYSSSMSVYWALLFGIAFILGLAIFALCYYSIAVSPRLDSLKGIAFYTTVAFVAALASSLGTFVWSLYHNLSPAETLMVWKGWWTGNFLQSILLVGPLLYFFTPTVERVKSHFFDMPESKVSMSWIYTAIISVTLVLALFIVGANILGSMGIEQELTQLPANIQENISKTQSSFQIITWISIGLIVSAGLGGIYLVGTWNKVLTDKVEEKTKQLQEKEQSLTKALDERDQLLNKVNNRVKDNFTMVLALLELQLKTGKLKSVEETLKDSHARLRSLALVYETMHQTEAVDYLNLKQYCVKLSNRLSRSFKKENRTIDVHMQADEVKMEIGRAVPLAMILNELLVNAYTHGFGDQDSGTIFVEITEDEHDIQLAVRDNGVALPEDFDPPTEKTLGMKLILTLTRQLQGTFDMEQAEKTSFYLKVPKEVA